MANGCVCCTVRGDLIEIFKKLQRRKDRFDRIIVETTGMADPAPVCQTFFVDEGVRSFAKIDAGEQPSQSSLCAHTPTEFCALAHQGHGIWGEPASEDKNRFGGGKAGAGGLVNLKATLTA